MPALARPSSFLWLALPFCVLWTSAFPAAKLALPDCPPLLLLTMRFLLAGALLMGWAALRGERLPGSRRVWGQLAVFALINPTLYLGLSWIGMVKASSALSTILISLNPVVVTLLAALFLREQLTGRKMLGLLLGLGGVVLVVQARLSGSGAEDPFSVLLIGLALIALAASTLLWKLWPLTTPRLMGTALQLLLAGVFFLPVALLTESPAGIHWTPRFLWAMAWIIGPVSIGAYLLWFRMLDTVSASEASAWHFLNPPLGLAMGVVALGETLQTGDLIGIVPIAAGIALVTRSTAAAPAPASAR
ncbi:DMT family transporter [Novispirillum itersonii]|uniref:DMT family transporter n=1 Tax=Novispirillum itersonii TaxID=189 RepID=UPI00037D238E|nr:DMT family transporter [Novispirillum itersonii]